jgi:3',5'-cyclic AMP phosphodiesterase CpdA
MALLGSAAPPLHVIAHLSDPHLIPGDRLLGGHIDTVAQFRQCLERVEASGVPFDAVVVSGDLADQGEPAAYALFRELVDPVVERLGAALVLTGGNHDERGPMARGIYGVDSDAPQDRVTWVGGLRLIDIDTALPGYHHGSLSDGQFTWLASELANPAPHGTLLVMHHPPIVYRSPVMQLLDFEDPARLADALTGTDVRAILSGHLHVTTFGTLSGIPVLVAGGVSYVDDVGVPGDDLMAVDGPQSWSIVEVHPDQVVSTAVPVDQHKTWPALPAGVMDFMATVPPLERREVFSRKRS